MYNAKMEVLVFIGDNNRIVSISEFGSSQEELKAAILEKFSDVLDAGDRISCLQKWNVEWNEFVDLGPKEQITGPWKLKAIIAKPKQPCHNPDSENSDSEDPDSNTKLVVYCTDPVSHDNDDDKNVGRQPADTGPGAYGQPTKMWGGRDVLFVHFLNPEVMGEGNNAILAWANSWSSDLVPDIPTFERTDSNEKADIRVEFGTANGRCWSKVGQDARLVNDPTKPTMFLALKDLPPGFQKYLVIHEFGHSLGLLHEHQRSDFWKAASGLLSVVKMRDDPRIRHMSDRDFKRDFLKFDGLQYDDHGALKTDKNGAPLLDENCVGTKTYDSDSIMHYWFDVKWLVKEKYKDLGKVSADKDLTPDQKTFIRGIHQRSNRYASKPSKTDLEFLQQSYAMLKSSKPSRQNVGKGASLGQMPPDSGNGEEITEGKNGHTNGQGSQRSPVIVSKGASGCVILDFKKHHQILYESAFDARTKWVNLGSKLGVDPITLESIKKSKDGDDDNFRNMLMKWLQRGTNCYLHVFLDALKSPGVEVDYLCDSVEKAFKLPNTPGQSSTPADQVPTGRKRERTLLFKASGKVPELTQSNLVDMLNDLHDPMMFGAKLRIDKNVLKKIETKHSNDIDKQKLDLFGHIESNTKTLGISWERIADVVKEMGHGNTSEGIRDTCCIGGPSPAKKTKIK